MLKTIFFGLWAIGMVVAGQFAHAFLQSPAGEHGTASEELPIEQIETELTGVPVIAGGRVEGYLLYKAEFSLDRNKLAHKALDVRPYLSDAAFRALFDFAYNGVKRIRGQDIVDLAAAIEILAEERLGGDAISAVNLEQFNLIRADEVRNNLFKIN
jgi:hypothetical protein